MTRPLHYDPDGNPIDFMEWAAIFRSIDRHVADTYDQTTRVRVSTVYLGLDHNIFGPTPLIYETMAFRHGGDGELPEVVDMERTPNRVAALAAHDRMVVALRDASLLGGVPPRVDEP